MDLLTTDSDKDGSRNDCESDDDKKPIIVTTASAVVPKSRIFLYEQAFISNIMKNTSGKDHISTSSSAYQKVIIYFYAYMFQLLLCMID